MSILPPPLPPAMSILHSVTVCPSFPRILRFLVVGSKDESRTTRIPSESCVSTLSSLCIFRRISLYSDKGTTSIASAPLRPCSEPEEMSEIHDVSIVISQSCRSVPIPRIDPVFLRFRILVNLLHYPCRAGDTVEHRKNSLWFRDVLTFYNKLLNEIRTVRFYYLFEFHEYQSSI